MMAELFLHVTASHLWLSYLLSYTTAYLSVHCLTYFTVIGP